MQFWMPHGDSNSDYLTSFSSQDHSHVHFTLVLISEEVGQLPSEVCGSMWWTILKHCVGKVLALVSGGECRGECEVV